MKMKNQTSNHGWTFKRTIAILCLAALPAFPVAINTAHADDKTIGQKIDDTVITAKVKKELLTDSQFKYGDVRVNTYKGSVELSGFVNSTEAKGHAIDVARGVEGTQEVKDSMTVK